MAYTRIQTTDSELNRVQDSVVSGLNNLGSVNAFNVANVASTNTAISGPAKTGTSVNFANGNLLQNVALVSGQDNLVPHLLNRTPVFWIIAGQDTQSVVWSPVTSKIKDNSNNPAASNASYINFQCSASCTIQVLIN